MSDGAVGNVSGGAGWVSEQRLRTLSNVMVVLLLAQYLIGMLVNFWTSIPDNHPGANPSEYFSGSLQSVWWALGASGDWRLASHTGLGVILGLLGILMIVLASMLRSRFWLTITIVGFIGVLAAGFNGASFLNYNEDFSSLIMAIAFIVALAAYGLGVYYSKPAA